MAEDHGDWSLGIKDGQGRDRPIALAGSYNNDCRHDKDRDDGGSRRRDQQDRDGGRKHFWRGMRDQSNYRDTAAYNPQPRRHRRHVAVPGDGSGKMPQQALMQVLDVAQHSSTLVLPRQRVPVTPALEALPTRSAPEVAMQVVQPDEEAHASDALSIGDQAIARLCNEEETKEPVLTSPDPASTQRQH
ncbi:hypothetical protein D1007_42309 [Hordeum vulgare]|nr:hypothetical protein D1007_42309 [Hordeum vulgare]